MALAQALPLAAAAVALEILVETQAEVLRALVAQVCQVQSLELALFTRVAAVVEQVEQVELPPALVDLGVEVPVLELVQTQEAMAPQVAVAEAVAAETTEVLAVPAVPAS